ncbi:MAG: cytochrome c [Actinobacteria bacterium]|nr:cytochrome c [Actinomycetota bacterium]
MLSTVTLVVAGLATANKIALAAFGGAFILFALVCSFVLPRRNPNFPGKYVGWFVVLGVVFFVAMISAVLVFGKEQKEKTAGESPAVTETRSKPLPSQTTSTPTTSTASTSTERTSTAATSTAPTSTPTPPAGGGDATAGKAVFASAGCGGCHTLKAAGASGNVGPNLDDLKPSMARVKNQVIHGGGAMPAFKGQLSDKQINDVSAYVSSVAGS